MSDDEIVIPGGTDDWSVPYPPFSIGDRQTIFEWCMAYVDRNPLEGATFFFQNGNHNEPTGSAMERRLRVLGTIGVTLTGNSVIGWFNDENSAISNEVYRTLVDRIKDKKIDATWVSPRDGPETRDYTLAVIGIDSVLDLARERGDYGREIEKLIVAATADTTQDQNSGTSIDDLAEWIFARCASRTTYKALYAEAIHHNQLRFIQADFKTAFQRVYVTKPHAPPKAGWPLRSPYKER